MNKESAATRPYKILPANILQFHGGTYLGNALRSSVHTQSSPTMGRILHRDYVFNLTDAAGNSASEILERINN